MSSNKKTVDRDHWSSIRVSLTKAEKMMKACISADQPFWLWGSPGIGKSEICRQLAREGDFDYMLELTPATFDLVDGRIPVPKEDVTVTRTDLRTGKKKEETIKGLVSDFAISTMFPRDGKTFLLCDDLATAAPILQPQFFALLKDKRIGTFELPEGSYVCAASNRPQDKAGATMPITPIRGRVTHIYAVPCIKKFEEVAIKQNFNAGLVAWVTGGIKTTNALNKGHDGTKVSDALSYFDVDDVTTGCSPRNIERLSHILNSPGFSMDCLKEFCCGTIGVVCGTQFSHYYESDYLRNIRVQDVLDDPMGCSLPDSSRPDLLYALLMQLLMAIDTDNSALNKKNARAATEFVMKRIDNKAKSSIFIHNAMTRNKNYFKMLTKEQQQYLIQNYSAIFASAVS